MRMRAVALSLAAALGSAHLPAAARDVALGWLEGAPPASATGVSFGVPWPRGAVQKGQALSLSSKDGRALPSELDAGHLARRVDQVDWIRHRRGTGGRRTNQAFHGKRRVAAGWSARVRSTDTAFEIDTARCNAGSPDWATTSSTRSR